MNQLISTKASEAPAVGQCAASAGPSMPDNCSEPESFASTSMPRNKAGSARQAKVTSRAAPIPSNAEPVSKRGGRREETAQP